MLTRADAAAEVMEHLCAHDAHGYSQPNRAGVGTGGTASETVTLSDGSTVSIAAGDRDCSSACIECYTVVGVDCGGAWYTGDMVAKMVATGNFSKLPASTWRSPQRGDLLVAQGKHVAMALGGGKLGEALRSENRSTTGAVGDQDGWEILTRSLYDDGWDCVLRYRGPEMEDEVTDADIQRVAEAVWSLAINGTQARDRLIGIDNAANGANNKLADTSDPTGRNVKLTDHDHIKWIGKSQQDIMAKVEDVDAALSALAEDIAAIRAEVEDL